MTMKRISAVSFAILALVGCGSDGGNEGAPTGGAPQNPMVAPPATGVAGAAAPMTTPPPSMTTPPSSTTPPTMTNPGSSAMQPGSMTTPPATTPSGNTVSKEAAAD